jgi:hemin transport system permease protein
MFYARRDALAARTRTLLIGLVVALLAMLVVIVSGFASGLTDDTTSAIARMPASHLSFARSASSEQFSRSLLPASTRARWAGVSGVQAATSFGTTIVHARSSAGTDLDLAVFGVQPGSFLSPAVHHGRPLSRTSFGVVVSEQLARKGVRVGQLIVVATPAVTMPVVGIAGSASFGHIPAAYVDLPVWQRLRFSVPATQQLPAAVAGQITGVALRVRAGTELGAADRRFGTRTVTKSAAFAGAPGYQGESTIMTTIRMFLFVIAALIVAAFFVVNTLQRQRELAVIRALGASTAYLLRTTLAQATLLIVPAVLAGAAAGAGLGSALRHAVPFQQTPSSVVTVVAALCVTGMAGSLLAARQVSRVDPMVALAAAR